MLFGPQIGNVFVMRFVVRLTVGLGYGQLVGHIAFAEWAGLWVMQIAPIPSLAERICIASQRYVLFCLQGSLGALQHSSTATDFRLGSDYCDGKITPLQINVQLFTTVGLEPVIF